MRSFANIIAAKMNGHSPSSDGKHLHTDKIQNLQSTQMQLNLASAVSHQSGTSEVTASPSREHHGPQPISPPPPSPQISAAELLLLTEASATNNGTFQCTLCNKQFGYKNGLIRHVRLTHVGEKPYQCSICNRRFGYKHILMEHQNLHFGNRPYACTLCDKRFAARSNLIQHRMVHRRPFNCALCSKRFDREEQLKKHLFAHPQSHLAPSHCNILGKGDLNQPANAAPGFMKEEGKGTTDASCTPSPDADEMCPYSMLTSRMLQPGLTGHRIDQICSQLSATGNSGQQQPTHYKGVVVKTEMIDNGEYSSNTEVQLMQSAQRERRVRSTEAKNTCSPVATSLSEKEMFAFSSHLGETIMTSKTWSSSEFATNTGSSTPVQDLSNSHQSSAMSSSALPGIHEMFSRCTGQKLPSFANFMPTASLAVPNLPHPILHNATVQQSTSSPFTSIPGGTVVQRPTAQLPPITQSVVRSTKDQAVQHSQTVTGFPSLDDVLAYYVSQGRLFRCQHCSILFFERGMYFLHASLHGLASPWECSICHKVCSDKNEFTLHFVNQQHHP